MTPPDNASTIERDLQAVDDALATGTATEAETWPRELQELALALRADSAEPRRDFAAELGQRVEQGFPRRPRSARARQRAALDRITRRNRLADRLKPWGPAAGLAAVLLVVVLGVTQLEGRPSDDNGADGGGGVAAEDPATQGDSGGSAGSAPDQGLALPGSGDDFQPGRAERAIEREISMTLSAPDDEIARVADGVTRVTGRYGGFVLRSNTNSDDEGASGYFELRIPTPRLQPAVRDLTRLATVKTQGQSGQDVTREVVTARDRLEAARAERRGLLRRLEVATTDEQAEAIRARLDLVAGEINGLRGQLRDLRLRTDYAIVTVDLAGEDSGGDDGGAGAGFGDALDDAGTLLVGAAGVLVRALAVALPLGVLALVGWIAARVLRRRRRESALA